VAAGYTSFARIAEANPRALEAAVNKAPPFGSNLREFALTMPRYR
jgi:hypothetical protein